MAAAPTRPTLVLLHEGLGSVAMWRDFPGRLAHATGCNALVYSRHGYGRSDPLTAPRAVRYMHDEALVDAAGAARSARDRAADPRRPQRRRLDRADPCRRAAIRPVAAVVTLAAHVLVEDISVSSIAAAKVAWETTDLRAKLARYHADVDSAFRGWNDIWLHPDFRAWNIEEYLPRIDCPVLAIQGEDDEYGTMEQMRRIGAQVRDVELVELEDCRHSPHRDQPAAVLDAITRFVDRVSASAGRS